MKMKFEMSVQFEIVGYTNITLSTMFFINCESINNYMYIMNDVFKK